MEISEKELKQKMEQFREWINRQALLPKDLDDKIVRRFLHSCYYDLEKAKTAMELFFSIRASSPELITNRDPMSPHMQKIINIINLAQYDISGNKFLWVWQLNDPGLENYDYFTDAKMFFLSSDTWLLDEHNWEDGDVILMDVKDISMKFLTKFNMSVARKLSKYQEDAMPIRLKEIHIVNAPPFIDKLYAIMKPFLKQELTEMIHFHVPNSETLYQYLSKEDLPSDYGGTRASVAELSKVSRDALVRHRSTIIDENFWKTDKKAKSSIEVGTFKSLDID